MKKFQALVLVSLAFFALLGSRQASVQAQSGSTSSPASIHFAIIGDYGDSGKAEADVANLVKSWNPDFIVTLGDNNYSSGAASTIDQNIGQYYHSYIYPYKGNYGTGAATNKFFPILGNHDWETTNAQPYINYFTLPGNERYYDFVKGPVHFFGLDSDLREPNGTSPTSTQGLWLKSALAGATDPWKIVLMHHAPYSSALHGSNTYMQWDYKGWGANIALAGHDHTYERIVVNGFPYIVNGLGGAEIYAFKTPVAGSQFRYNADYGALLVDATDSMLGFKFYDRSGTLIDQYYLLKTSFADVPLNYWALSWIDKLVNAKITSGCGINPPIFCPTQPVTRAGMAVFLLKGIHGSAYTPPAATGTVFGDVPANYWAAAWIEELSAEGITGGCGNGDYCPENTVTRDEMAVFLLRAEHGSAYAPPAATGTMFTDVPVNYWAADWIEQLANEGITSGCTAVTYCPITQVLRDQMAVFLGKTFNLP